MKVFIACSAKESISLDYKNLAADIATMLVRKGHKLVFGGFDSGMMGKCLMTFKYEGGKVKAIVEVHDAETVADLEVDTYEVYPTTFERTKGLYNSSDLVLVLSGGIGTLAELFSAIDEKRQKSANKHIVLFNYKDFYTPLLKYLEYMYKEGFIALEDLKRFEIVKDINTLERFLDSLEKKGRL